MNKDFTIYTQANYPCMWCDKAIDRLNETEYTFEKIPLESSVLAVKAAEAQMSTVPIIYYRDRPLGGYQDLLLKLGKD